MSKTLFNAYINSDSSSFDLKKEKNDNVLESAFDIKPEKEDSKYAVIDDFFTKKKIVQEADDMATTDTSTADTSTSTAATDVSDNGNPPNNTAFTPDTTSAESNPPNNTAFTPDNENTASTDATATTPDTGSASTETVQEGVVDKVKEHFSKEKRQERSDKRKLKKLKYDPESKTIEIEDDLGNTQRVHFNITDERSLKKAIDEIDKKLEGFSGNTKEENRKLLKERNKLVEELTEMVDMGAFAGVTVSGQTVVNISTDHLDSLSSKELLALMEHEKEHVRQYTRNKGTRSVDDPNLLLIDDASLEFIKQWRNTPKGKLLSSDHDRLDYELTADAAAVRKFGYRKVKAALSKSFKIVINHDTFINTMNAELRDVDKDFKRVERLLTMVGKSDKPLSDEEVRKLFDDVRDHLDTFRVAVAKTEQSIILASKTADSSFLAKLKKYALTLFNIFKEAVKPYKFCTKKNEEKILNLPPEERREAIRQLYSDKLDDTISKYNVKDMEEFYEKLREYNEKLMRVRFDFIKDYDIWYRKRRKRYVTEYLEYEFNNLDVVCEGYMMENLTDAVIEGNVYEESFNERDFHELRAAIAKELEDKYKVSSISQGSHEMFTISDDDTRTTVENLGDACKAVTRGDKKKIKVQFNNLPFVKALSKLKEIFSSSDTIMEGYMYDISRFSNTDEEDQVYNEYGMFDVGFGNLRSKLADALKDKFKVSLVGKGMSGKEMFTIAEPNATFNDPKTTVEATGTGCKVVTRGGGKFKCHFMNIPLSKAFEKIIDIFKQPELLTESMYDTYTDALMYMEADEDDGKSSEEILDETVEEASESENGSSDDDATDTEEADESIEDLTDKALDEIKGDIDDIKDDAPEPPEGDEDELVGFGTDDSDVQNEFDPKDIEILNKLVASESDAINDYFDAAKDCNDETLRRLYGDIGHEERFHLEQLLYAKSTLTGEKYEPKDPEVKREYEELIAMGMDEDTAANTAIDKAYSVEEVDEEEIAQEVADIYRNMLRENMINDIIFEQFDKKELDESMSVFVETYIYQEEMMNSAYASKEMKSIPNPFKLLLKAFIGFINMLSKLGHSLKESYTRSKMKRAARHEWIKKNGIAGLFKSGIYLYFYNPKISRVDVTDPCRYVDLLYRMSVMIGKQCGINVTTKHKTIKDPIKFNSIDEAVNILKRAMFNKTKVVVTDSNKDIIARDFFGYNPTKIDVKVQHGDDPNTVKDSDNAYNSLDILINVTEQYAEISKEVLEQLDKLEGDASSVFYKNRALYNSSVKNMRLVVNYFNKFISAIGHDMNAMLKLDQGLLAMTRERDSVEQSGGTWEGPDVRTTQGTATYTNKGEHTQVGGGKLTDRAARKAARKLKRAQNKIKG